MLTMYVPLPEQRILVNFLVLISASKAKFSISHCMLLASFALHANGSALSYTDCYPNSDYLYRWML